MTDDRENGIALGSIMTDDQMTEVTSNLNYYK